MTLLDLITELTTILNDYEREEYTQMIKVYTKDNCTNCTILAGGLKRRNLPYTKIDVTADGVLDALKAKYPNDVIRTLPVVEIGDHLLHNPSVITVADLYHEHNSIEAK